MQLDLTICPGPVGEIAIFSVNKTVYLVDFNDNRDRIDKLLTARFGTFEIRDTGGLPDIRERFERYFNGDWTAFEGLELDTGGTQFQQIVWNRLRAIAIGETWSYAELAQEVGRPRAVRAVANANARNPIAIIIPCHRVIGKNGAMRGYAGGVDRKTWLLRHEQAVSQV